MANAVTKANLEAKTMTAITPQVAMALVVSDAKATRSAALRFCVSVALFYMNVCHLHDANADGYMSQKAAGEEIEKQLKKAANVQGGMLSHYVRTGSTLYGKLVISGKPTKVGAPIVKALADAKTEKDLIEVQDLLLSTLEKSAGVKSFRDLSEQMGYKSFAARETGSTAITKDKAVERVVNAMTSIANAASKGNLKGTTSAAVQTAVTHAVVEATANPLALVREALVKASKLDNINPDDFAAIIELATSCMNTIIARRKAQKAETKVQAKGKGKTPPAHVIAKGKGSAASPRALHSPV
jgi:hypothetical protein